MTKTITGKRPHVQTSEAVVCKYTVGNNAARCLAIDPSRTPAKAYVKKTK